jgi:hypothetical protein
VKRAKLSDLDPATRRRLLKGQARAPRTVPPASGVDRLGRDLNRYRCGACGRLVTGYTVAERHILGAHGGGTISLVLHGDA